MRDLFHLCDDDFERIIRGEDPISYALDELCFSYRVLHQTNYSIYMPTIQIDVNSFNVEFRIFYFLNFHFFYLKRILDILIFILNGKKGEYFISLIRSYTNPKIMKEKLKQKNGI